MEQFLSQVSNVKDSDSKTRQSVVNSYLIQIIQTLGILYIHLTAF